MASKYDVDTYLNPYTPRSPLHLLPQSISHLLGYRPPHSSPRKPHTLIVWLFCFIGGFLGIALIEGVYLHLPFLGGHQVPVIIASFGAGAILEYNTIESPLAQPRNLVLGQFLGALIGVSITKLFGLLPHNRFEELRWLAGALAVGTASLVMAMTKTTHPPAGATALITATTAEIIDLGWWTLPVILLGCMLMLTSALILNNIYRQFPMYWWTPADLSRKEVPSIEKSLGNEPILSNTRPMDNMGQSNPSSEKGDASRTSVQPVAKATRDGIKLLTALQRGVMVSKERITVPEWLQLSDFERSVLQILQEKLLEGEPFDDTVEISDETDSATFRKQAGS